MLASLPVCGTETCTVLASLDSDLYMPPDHCGQRVNFAAKAINLNGTEHITACSDADGIQCANKLSWRMAKEREKPVQALCWRLSFGFVRLQLLTFSNDDKYARAAAEKDLIALAKDLSKSRLSITCVMRNPVSYCRVPIS